MPHRRLSPRAGRLALGADSDGWPWLTATVAALLVATGEGNAEALGELFGRSGAPAVNGALRACIVLSAHR